MLKTSIVAFKAINRRLNRFLAPKCVDCWGTGKRTISDVPGHWYPVRCRLCRGTGRILDDDTKEK